MRIPEFSRTVLPDNSVGIARAQVARAPYGQKAEVINQAQRATAAFTNNALDYVGREAQARNATAVNQASIEFKKQSADLENTMRQQRADSPENFHKDFDGELQKLSDQFVNNAPSEAAKTALRTSLDNQRAGAYESNLQWERTRSVENFASSVDRSQQTAATISAERGKAGQPIDDLLRDADATAIAGSTIVQGADKVERIRLAGRKRVIDAAINSAIQYNPDYALKLIEQYGQKQEGFEGAINTVMKNEGGFVASDGASGAPAIYGINRKWHPEAYDAAKKITDEKGEEAGQEYARLFYKEEFWDKNNIGQLPAEAQTVVMDGVVNHTGAFSKKLIEAAKGGASQDELIDMREAEYRRLAKANPAKYENSLPGWLNRLDGLRQERATDPESMQKYEKEAKASLIKLDDTRRIDRVVAEAQTEKDLYERFTKGELQLAELTELQEKGDVKPEFAAFLRESIVKANPIAPEEQNEIYTDAFDQVAQLEIKRDGGQVKIGNKDATLEDMLRLQQKLIKESVRGVTGLRPLLNKLSPAILLKAKVEQGNDDIGLEFPFTSSETYDAGYEVIQDYLEKQKKDKDYALKSSMLSNFVDMADRLPPEVLGNQAQLDVQLASIANTVIAKATQQGMKSIPVPAIKHLLDNPSTAPQFDAIFGTGAANKVLGK